MTGRGHDTSVHAKHVQISIRVLLRSDRETEGQGPFLDQTTKIGHVSEAVDSSTREGLSIRILAREVHIAALERGRKFSRTSAGVSGTSCGPSFTI